MNMEKAKKRGDSYRIRVCVGRDKNGNRKFRSITASTKKEAERKAAKLQIQQEYSEDCTFGEAVQRYIDSKSYVLSPATLRGYLGIKKKHIGIISGIRLSQLTNEMLQLQINEVAADHSPKTVANVRGLITSVLKMFAPDKVVNLHLRVPPKTKSEKIIPTDEEVRKLIATSAAHKRKDELPIILAAFGSLRRGEISALYPDCIFDDHITIKRDYVLDMNEKWVLKNRPKSSAGFRDVPLPPEIIKRLKELSKGQKPGIDPYGIFGLTPNMIYEYFRGTMKKAGLSGFDFHSLRHFFATMMHQKGVPDKTIAKIGGWDDMNTLQRIYQHSTKKAEDAAAQILFEEYSRLMTSNETTGDLSEIDTKK